MTSYLPIDASATGHLIDALFWLATILITVAFIAVIGILVTCLIRFRERPGYSALYTHGNSRQAVMLTLSFAVIVFFAIDVNLAYHDHKAWEEMWGQAPDPATAVRIEVMPEQFAWNVRYAGADNEFNTADDVTTMNLMHIPANKPVIVQLRSKDVIHSFFLPNFRIKMDAVPGIITALYFEGRREGEYDIACAEHCGLGHYRMQGKLVVESQEKFDAWLVQAAAEKADDTMWGWPWAAPSRAVRVQTDKETSL